PRATDGDSAFEPDWQERLALKVGPRGGDLTGNDDRVLQAALDYVARLGGGTVQLLPGTYTLRAAVSIPSHVRLRGSGADSVITKIPSERVKLSADSDWYDQEITVGEKHSFQVGDSVVLMSRNPHTNGQTVIKRTLVARSGNRFKLNDGLRENLWLSGEPTCASLFPLLTSEHTSDVVIENLTLDGNLANNENFNGNYGGCIFLQDCNRYTFRQVEARNYNGDGISFQICHDVVVDDCHCHDNQDLGVHPGSGSQRPLIRNCRLERNTIGLFWCWGVKYGLAEGNRIDGNRNYGISIGHNDTDNVMRNNEVARSGKVGILFRDEARGADFWPNRNVVENNRILDSGEANGVAIDVQGRTKDVRIVGNTIRETRQPMSRTGIRISAQAERILLSDNAIDGFAQGIDDRRSPAA
ncbi:MAG: right-handed parallel beta-helix repeat-containing protein, partial [Pirellulaceae bacterium]